jgi:hypothetical protein
MPVAVEDRHRTPLADNPRRLLEHHERVGDVAHQHVGDDRIEAGVR